MRYSSRFFLYAPLAGLLLLAAIAMMHWWIVASALARRLDAVNGHEIMPGVRVSFAEKRIAGFPFRTDTILKSLRVEIGETDGPVIWTSESFAAHELTYGRVQAIFEAAGKQSLSWTDPHGAQHRFVFLPGTFRASSILADGRLVRFDSQIVDLDGAEFSASEMQLHLRATSSGVDVYFTLKNANSHGGYAADLGPRVTNLVASGSLDHSSQLQSMLRGDGPPAAALEDWRTAGGVLTVKDLALTRRNTTMHFSGKLALDSHHDLVGVLAGAAPNSRKFSVLNFTGGRIASSGVARP